jgi:hypothetical protein
MEPSEERSAYRVAWSCCGFLFPVVIMAIGFTFERGHPPGEADLAQAWVQPDVLNVVVIGLALCHLTSAFVAVAYWSTRVWVWVATAAQLLCTLCATFLSGMAVNGTWP